MSTDVLEHVPDPLKDLNSMIISVEINGYLIKGTDSESISVVVNKAVDNNREIMRNNAIKTVRKNYNLELYVASEKSIFLNIN